jgi:hypothetical protein
LRGCFFQFIHNPADILQASAFFRVLVITLTGLFPTRFSNLRQNRGTAIIPVKIPGNISFGVVIAITNQFHD